MASFADSVRAATDQHDYREELRAYVKKYEDAGNRLMPADVFELGVRLKGVFRPAEWAAWFTKMEMSDHGEGPVNFYTESAFTAHYASTNFRFQLELYFRRPVKFNVEKKQPPLKLEYHSGSRITHQKDNQGDLL